MHEKLTEEQKIEIGYSTLTRLTRAMGLGQPPTTRCGRVPDERGREMQHDTSPYTIVVGDTRVKVVASLLYLRYCKMRYLRFYRRFDRFRMKCFFHEALLFFGYGAPTCVIDNTNLARLRGTGKDAVIVPEMEAFSRQYGFRFLCHEIGHANRKAGVERGFYTVETNFFPGRTFTDMNDLNRQAKEWATERMARRPVRPSGLIPCEAFEAEKAFLIPLAPHLPAPYRSHERGMDPRGYITFNGNFYWVPGEKIFPVKLLEYGEQIKIYHNRHCLVTFALPPDGVRAKIFFPAGHTPPKYKPKNRKPPTAEEEKQLRARAQEVDVFLTFALDGKKGRERHRWIRRFFSLSHKVALPILIAALQRARDFQITELPVIERMIRYQLNNDGYEMPTADIDDTFRDRESYQAGLFSTPPDFSIYDQFDKEEEQDE